MIKFNLITSGHWRTPKPSVVVAVAVAGKQGALHPNPAIAPTPSTSTPNALSDDDILQYYKKRMSQSK